ncbi:hypothetical protein BLNAU_7441 [Blattamonas nauphoetae]|uniref:Uncharacterized protein n=1 Tax=Blattamonas nauphoetae TaxID=2049346 RepID=A0ABQ9Y1D3_9EUKA|nr:hypothetical protein BLNAU_7441 [Blattamonas nauphoetae]
MEDSADTAEGRLLTDRKGDWGGVVSNWMVLWNGIHEVWLDTVALAAMHVETQRLCWASVERGESGEVPTLWCGSRRVVAVSAPSRLLNKDLHRNTGISGTKKQIRNRQLERQHETSISNWIVNQVRRSILSHTTLSPQCRSVRDCLQKQQSGLVVDDWRAASRKTVRTMTQYETSFPLTNVPEIALTPQDAESVVDERLEAEIEKMGEMMGQTGFFQTGQLVSAVDLIQRLVEVDVASGQPQGEWIMLNGNNENRLVVSLLVWIKNKRDV